MMRLLQIREISSNGHRWVLKVDRFIRGDEYLAWLYDVNDEMDKVLGNNEKEKAFKRW